MTNKTDNSLNSNRGMRIYAAIDLKSFYASVECIERGLDPLTTNLVVADASRSEKTICLAVTPPLKTYGLSGRSRLFEVVQKLKEVNALRIKQTRNYQFMGESFNTHELHNNPNLKVDFIAATPRMALYMEYSARIYQVYLKYVAPEDVHVYSIDEVFIDLTDYLKASKMKARNFVKQMIIDVFNTVGVTAAAGIGTNLYLSKIAMDIVAKHIPADEDGVRIAELTEMRYRKLLWSHKPLTDFWRVGRGYAKKLEQHQLYTMGDIARCSLENEDLLYKLFGINGELLIDHAWGWESCTLADVKAYKPSSKSTGAGQVLHHPYPFKSARIIVQEMIDILVLDLVEKGWATDQIVLTVGYDISNLSNPEVMENYTGQVKADYYGRKVPTQAHGSINLGKFTSSTKRITEGALKLFDEIVNPMLLVRRVNVSANHLTDIRDIKDEIQYEQLDFFTDYAAKAIQEAQEAQRDEKEMRIQKTLIDLKKKFGKNAVLKGTNLQEDANAKNRNNQIGGHKA